MTARGEYLPEPGERNGEAGRTTTGIAWCWQDKKALRKIREAFDRTNTVSSALAVYVALTEIASDRESPTFETTHAYLGQRSGCSIRTVFSRLKELQEIGIIGIETPAMRAPSTITVLPVSQPLPNVLQRTKKASLRRSEVSLEEHPEEKGEAHTPAAPSAPASRGGRRERQDWESTVKKQFPREHRALIADLKKQRKECTDVVVAEDLSQRINFVEIQLYGAQKPKPIPTPAKQPKPKQIEPKSAEQILEHSKMAAALAEWKKSNPL